MDGKIIVAIVILGLISFFSWIPLLLGLAVKKFTGFYDPKNISMYTPGILELGVAIEFGLIIIGAVSFGAIWAIITLVKAI